MHTARWYSSWLLFTAYFPIIILYSIWIPLTFSGTWKPRDNDNIIFDVEDIPVVPKQSNSVMDDSNVSLTNSVMYGSLLATFSSISNPLNNYSGFLSKSSSKTSNEHLNEKDSKQLERYNFIVNDDYTYESEADEEGNGYDQFIDKNVSLKLLSP